METLIGAGGIVFAAAVTPGPNNFVVMRSAARSGFVSALPAIAGIVSGGLTLLLLLFVGAGAIFVAQPQLRTAVAIGGCLYLSWLGVRIIAVSFGKNALRGPADSGDLPSGIAGQFAFQFLNPKSWAMVLSATSAIETDAGGFMTFAQLAAIFTIIPIVCLVFWSSLGTMMAKYLTHPTIRAGFDRAMGMLLIASAVLLLVEV